MPLFSFAQRVGVTYKTARCWIKDGLHGGAVKLTARRVGGRVYIAWSDYEDFTRRLETWRAPTLPLVPARERRRAEADTERWLLEMGLISGK